MSMVACSDGLVVTNTYPDYYYYRPTPVVIHHYNYVRPPYRPMMPPPPPRPKPKPRPHYRPNNNYRSYGNRTFGNRQPGFGSRTQTRPGNSTGQFGNGRR